MKAEIDKTNFIIDIILKNIIIEHGFSIGKMMKIVTYRLNKTTIPACINHINFAFLIL
jgi:hypothetical protein